MVSNKKSEKFFALVCVGRFLGSRISEFLKKIRISEIFWINKKNIEYFYIFEFLKV
jgi:hypothetical protein